jgi:hypothetical protein
MNNTSGDWAWPALIQSLQHDIARLHELMDEERRDNAQARSEHRRQLDALIEQLRDVRAELDPIVDERRRTEDLRNKTWWAWA